MMNVARIISRTFSGPLRLSMRHYVAADLLKNCKTIVGFRTPPKAQYENAKLLRVFPRVVNDLTANDDDGYKHFYQTFRNALESNVPNYPMLHGNTAVNTYKLLHKNPDLITEEELYLVQVIGWSYEIIREFLFILDDVVDSSETRHGKPCWYKHIDVGPSAVIDSFLMYTSLFGLVKKYFSDKPYYVQIIETMQQYGYESLVGQKYGILLTANFQKTRSLAEFTFKSYEKMTIMNATGLNYGPIVVPMWMHGIMDPVTHSQVKYLGVLLAKFFTELGDILDIFGDAGIMGKLPTDILEGRCAWPIITALPLCNSAQVKMLEENYGKPDSESVNRVLELFVKLRLDDLYIKHAKDSYERIVNFVERPDFKLPANIFSDALHFMYTKEN